MAQIGVFDQSARIELIDGELIDMAPIGPLHAAIVNDVAELINQRKPDDVILSIQNPIVLGNNSEPQPDITLLRSRTDRYRTALPQASDVLLIIEIADSSLKYDQQHKIPLYARHMIAEVWLFDLQTNCVTLYRDPDSDTDPAYYRQQKTYQHSQLQSQVLQSLSFDLSDLW